MAIEVPKNGSIQGFAIIVDINGYSNIVAHPDANLIAQFTRDVLYGSVNAVENNNGIVVGFMGDALLAFIEDAEDVGKCCYEIAKDIDKQCEYLSNNSDAFPFAPKGPSLKIGIEYGYFDVSEIWSKFLGNQRIFAGVAINYAQRISNAEIGNRCLVGPKAYEMGMDSFTYKNGGPYEIEGKNGEGKYVYYQVNLGDIWREGETEESYWG
jgi:class 3 adenylate cyclase